MDFENANKELEQIIEKLESGEVSLSESVKLFERGTELIKLASQELEGVKGKVTVIKNELDNFNGFKGYTEEEE